VLGRRRRAAPPTLMLVSRDRAVLLTMLPGAVDRSRSWRTRPSGRCDDVDLVVEERGMSSAWFFIQSRSRRASAGVDTLYAALLRVRRSGAGSRGRTLP